MSTTELPAQATTDQPTELRCPRCGERRPVRIVYRFATAAMGEAQDRGEIALGGCIIRPGAPMWRCRRCGREWSDEAGPSLEGMAGISFGSGARRE